MPHRALLIAVLLTACGPEPRRDYVKNSVDTYSTTRQVLVEAPVGVTTPTAEQIETMFECIAPIPRDLHVVVMPDVESFVREYSRGLKILDMEEAIAHAPRAFTWWDWETIIINPTYLDLIVPLLEHEYLHTLYTTARDRAHKTERMKQKFPHCRETIPLEVSSER